MRLDEILTLYRNVSDNVLIFGEGSADISDFAYSFVSI